MGIYDGKVPTSGKSLPEARSQLVPSPPGRDCCILSNLTGGVECDSGAQYTPFYTHKRSIAVPTYGQHGSERHRK